MPNIFDPEFDDERDHGGFSKRRAWVGRQAGAEKLGASVWEVEPGEAAYPYHLHYSEEELLIVLSGAPTLRTPDGERVLVAGEVVAFPAGPDSAHQVINYGDVVVRFLALSTIAEVDAIEYPDSEKISVAYRRGQPEGFRHMTRKSAAVDFWEGEEPPPTDDSSSN